MWMANLNRLFFLLLLGLVNPCMAIDNTLLEDIKTGVVRILGISKSLPGLEREISSGSGFLINTQDYVVTNRHVLIHKPSGKFLNAFGVMTSHNPEEWLEAELVWESQIYDLAILKVPGVAQGRHPLELGPPKLIQLQNADDVWSIGYPGASDTGVALGISLVPKQDKGVVRAMEPRIIHPSSGIQVNTIDHGATINSGNSGGPLVDDCGRVVAINTLKAVGDGVEGTFFSVSSEYLVQQLKTMNISFALAESRCQPANNTIITIQNPDNVGQTSESNYLLWAVVLAIGLLISTLLFAIVKKIPSYGGRGGAGSGSRSGGEVVSGSGDDPGGCDVRSKSPNPPQVSSFAGYLIGTEKLNGLSEKIVLNGSLLIGRSGSCDVVIDNDYVSRQHARVGWDSGHKRFWLENLSRVNGSYIVNSGSPIKLNARERVWLDSGQMFFLWRPELSFKVIHNEG